MCITDPELQESVTELRRLKTMKSEIEDMIKFEENKIVEYMQENKLECKKGDDYQISYKQQSRSTFDKDLLIPVLGEDLSPYKKRTEYMALRVK